MNAKQEDENKDSKKPTVIKKNGLHVLYDEKELEEFYPHLMKEIKNKEKMIKIEGVVSNLQKNMNGNTTIKRNFYEENLSNPGVIDFIRRCSNNKEAVEILDFLLKRNEITKDFYDELYFRITQEKDGLKRLINECGGFKKPGYYEKKFYKKKA
ncbi:MAG: DUF2095 family protein [Promethearchaeota archaeon]